MRHLIVSTLALGLCLAPLAAEAAAPESKGADEANKGAAKDRILGALDLPIKAQALRKAGADEKEVKAGLKAAKDKKAHPKDVAELLDAAAKATKEHGPVDNFGAFVQSKLDAGLRGKDLAEAIRAEHEARGKKGKGHEGKAPDEAKQPGGPDDKGGGKPEDAGNEGKGAPDDKGGGKPEDAGNEGKGPPDGKGAPDDKGGKPEDAGAADKGGKPEDKGGKPEAKAEDNKGGKPEAKAEDQGKKGK
jgi:hypothetical protein